MSSAASSSPPEKNVLTVVRVRPVPNGTDVCWSLPQESPKQIQLIDVKGKPTTAYGLGKSTS
jgi:hypothetical protein